METKEDHQTKIEAYLEENKIYDIFEDMLKQLITDLPSDPIEYLLEKLSTSPSKILYIIGNNGPTQRSFISKHLTNEKNVILSMHEILQNQVCFSLYLVS